MKLKLKTYMYFISAKPYVMTICYIFYEGIYTGFQELQQNNTFDIWNVLNTAHENHPVRQKAITAYDQKEH